MTISDPTLRGFSDSFKAVQIDAPVYSYLLLILLNEGVEIFLLFLCLNPNFSYSILKFHGFKRVLIMNKLWESLDFTISQFSSYEICLADVIHLCESWFQPKKRLKEQNRADKNSLGSQNMVITYLWKDVHPQCASLTGEITSWHELLCSYGDSYMRLRLIK